MCYRADGDACICPNSYRDLYKTQHDCGRKKSKLRRSIVFRLRRTSPPRRRRCRRLASYGLVAFASYGLLASASYDGRLRFLCFPCLGLLWLACLGFLSLACVGFLSLASYAPEFRPRPTLPNGFRVVDSFVGREVNIVYAFLLTMRARKRKCNPPYHNRHP